ncbi:MAG: DUF177 domain-containing protein, partial [Desulfobacterales bacterium]|nr:DUF177 domain-containing protein [Desulfobacterales bacterium]
VIIDLRTIPEETRISEVYEKDWWDLDEQDDKIQGLVTPLQVLMQISRVGDQFVLKGGISGRLAVLCDRCLEPFHWDLDAEFSVFLALPPPGADQPDVELFEEDKAVDFIRGELVDLDEIVREQVYLTLPMKSVCRGNCLGFCPLCGANLNEGVCKCRKETGHSAFSKLKNFKFRGETR